MKQPPRLPYRPPRWGRYFLWSVFTMVVAARILFRWEMPPNGPPRFAPMDRGPGGGGWGRWGGRTEMHPPSSPVPGDLWRITIEVAPRDVAALRGYFWGGRGGNTADRPEVNATVREGGVVYTNVTLHLKGSAGSFRSVDDKPAMTLNFAKHVSGRRFHDFAKLSLNNSVQDDTYLCEKLCREIFNEGGVPVPQAEHATVILNGRDLGLYVVTEGWGKPFLRRHFPDPDGNLYDGGFVREIDGGLDINSGDEGENRAILGRLMQATREQDPKQRWKLLTERLDVERFASMVALEVMMCHWDGYSLNRNNYRVFHDRSTDRLVFMPHGLDQMFGTGGRMWPNAPIEPRMRGDVARAFLSVPEGRRMYLDHVARFRTNLFASAKLTNRVLELSARIRPTLAAYDAAWARRHDDRVSDLCQRIAARTASIEEQLGGALEPVKFAEDGSCRPKAWKSRLNQQGRGGPAPRFVRGEVDGRMVLRVQAAASAASSSWRARLLLEQGRYRFEGLARTGGAAQAGGVTLRISGAVRPYVALAGEEWTPLSYEFEVGESVGEVELVCDVAAGTPEASFDEQSLRVVRLGKDPGPGERPE